MKRKKWTEEEEQTLLHSYSSLFSSSTTSLSKLRTTRQKKFQPIADRVNSHHHLLNPSSYPFLWSWRDVSIKIQNMRHQYLNVKQKVLSSSPHSSFDWEHGVNLWPNFIRYKDVFGDIDLDSSPTKCLDIDEFEEEEEEEGEEIVNGRVNSKKRKERMVAKEEEQEYIKERWRREERREEEEMEWMERVVGMQMEHEKQAMQMHADACQAQLQILGILVRVVCQFLGPGAGGSDVVMQNLQQEQREEEETTESLVGGDGKNDGLSGGGYL